MNLALYFAKRYLFSKKSTNAINIISAISMVGVLIGTAALIIILSVFNGFEVIVLSLYNKFTPDIKVEIAKGKTFDPTNKAFAAVKIIHPRLFMLNHWKKRRCYVLERINTLQP